MTAHGRLLMRVLLVALAGAAACVAIECVPPPKYDGCGGGCLVIDARACQESGRTFLPRATDCNYCDLCVSYVERHQPCNYTTWADGPAQRAAPQTHHLCPPPLLCSRPSGGVCVRASECDADGGSVGEE